MTVRDELLALIDDDQLTPTVVYDWTQHHPRSDLHRALEWDDKKAGYQYRLWQIRSLIAIHVITPERRREMISLSVDRVMPGGGYRTITSVMQSQTLRDVALADALAELERVQKKYEYLSELAGVWAAAQNVKRKEVRKTKHRRSSAGVEARQA